MNAERERDRERESEREGFCTYGCAPLSCFASKLYTIIFPSYTYLLYLLRYSHPSLAHPLSIYTLASLTINNKYTSESPTHVPHLQVAEKKPTSLVVYRQAHDPRTLSLHSTHIYTRTRLTLLFPAGLAYPVYMTLWDRCLEIMPVVIVVEIDFVCGKKKRRKEGWWMMDEG